MKLTALSITLACLLPLTAQAGNVKAFPGYGCLTNAETVTRLGSACSNTDLAAHTVACPTVREYISKDLQKAVVVVVDQNPTADVTCTLEMKTPEGAVFASQTLSSSGSSASPQTLTFGSLASADQGHLQLYCTIPGTSSGLESSVVSYRINEDAP